MFDGFDMWIIPVHKGAHWTMLVINIQILIIKYYYSMFSFPRHGLYMQKKVVDFQEKIIHYSDSLSIEYVE